MELHIKTIPLMAGANLFSSLNLLCRGAAHHSGMVEHNGKLVLSVGALDGDIMIVLKPGGQISHPVNVQPPAHPTM